MAVKPLSLMDEFQGPNLGYLLELYERYQQDPASVDSASREILKRFHPPTASIQQGTTSPMPRERGIPPEIIVAVANLAQSIRSFGHLNAQLDPLGSPPPGDPSLELSHHGLSQTDLINLPAILVSADLLTGREDGNSGISPANAAEAIQTLKDIYCGRTGYDYSHILLPDERFWLRNTAETRQYYPSSDPNFYNDLLVRLTQVEVFEQFLQRSFPGRTRFSIEGVDMLIPILDEMIREAEQLEICMMLIGMAHRGRLNVLTHILKMPYDKILAEFRDPGVKPNAWQELGWTGDVKYHKGASLAVGEDEIIQLVINMPPNPSHLEHINPVIEGMARSAGNKVNRPGLPEFFPKASIPILIHGDASFSGQGVVTETLNLSNLDGYATAGTIHIITNNQLGYTAAPSESRSSPYASDFARGLKIPIMHVNADDPLACVEAARTALAYRSQFHKDFLIDLVGYRRYGHNEGDEPAFTQPVMYRIIQNHPTVRALWAQRLVDKKLIPPELPDQLVQQGLQTLQKELDRLIPAEAVEQPRLIPPPPGAARSVRTSVPLERLKQINQSLLEIPQNFHINKRLMRDREKRVNAFKNPDLTTIDWSSAEQLAFAAILQDGIAIRLTGQDTIRGTFSQRHAQYYDEENGASYTPLHAVRKSKASFESRNSPLSENAALGFEFGYSIQSSDRLVLWEAQYGDFANGAQTMIDEFVTSARAKWGQTPSLVMLLPHGNEGQGPDHSSGRPERFLQLAAEINLRIAQPTTASQYFHLLRRQAALLKSDPLPLIVFTPKGLLRHPLTTSCPRDLSEGSWQPLLAYPNGGDPHPSTDAIHRMIICSGRVYTDLVSSPIFSSASDLALFRLEQLYPFPAKEIEDVLKLYPSLSAITWVQEEPSNMGAWSSIKPQLEQITGDQWSLAYVGRPASSSPAEGSTAWYSSTQKGIVDAALRPLEDAPANVSAGVLIERG